MRSTLNIAIVGAGFAGLASAALLARQGHSVTVFEQFESPQAVGAGILIQPSGLAAMRSLGILDAVLSKGAPINALYGVNAKGAPVIDIAYADWRAGSYGLGLHRGVLFNALWNSAIEAGVTIKTAHAVHDLKELAGFDLRVIADGSHSALREQMGLPCQSTQYPWGAVWTVLPDPKQSYGSALWQWYRQAHQMLGIMPTGLAPNNDTPVVSVFWSVRHDRYEAFQTSGLQAWKDHVLSLNPACAALLEQVTDIKQLTWARYYDVVMPKYHTQNAVIIGDAAHAMSPQLGQGTNLALLDAVALADCVSKHTDVAQSLAAYTQVRKNHIRYYSQASRALTPVFQSDLKLIPWLRDLLMARSSKWPVLGKANLQTLVGVRTGWLGGQIDA